MTAVARYGLLLAAVLCLAADAPNDAERRAIDALARTVDGAMVYSHKGRVYRIDIGATEPTDLGPGKFARWSKDGKHIAVVDGDDLIVMNADGTDRTTLLDDVYVKDGCPIEFHPDGEHVLFVRRGQPPAMVNIDTKQVHETNLRANYTGELSISADGKRMCARLGHDLFAIDTATGKHRRYGRGCSSNVSPSGKLILQNTGDHRRVAITPWAGGKADHADVRTLSPDKTWDNHHWSNHEHYIAAQGDRGRNEAYVVHLPTNTAVRMTWTGKVAYPDVHIGDAR